MVVAIIAVLLAILLPGLGMARTAGRRVACQGNLRQISLAWQIYLEDNDGYFYQAVNANHDFGGWQGTAAFAAQRPLNPYLGMPEEITSESAGVFRCAADKGGILGQPQSLRAFDFFGNSYQTNIFMIGPNQVGINAGIFRELHEKVNTRLNRLNLNRIERQDQVVLLGDNNWAIQCDVNLPAPKAWHGKDEYHNIGFLDGRTDFVHIIKGKYVADDYNIIPFRDLIKTALEAQESAR